MAGGTGVAYPVALTEVGLAVEVTKGTPVVPAFWLPVKSPKYKPNQMVLPDETLQGSMVKVFDDVLGMSYDSHGWDSYPYLDSFPNLVRAELGSTDNKTVAGAATTIASTVAAGDNSIHTVLSVAAGSYIVIGSGATLEVKITGTPTGSANPFTIPVTTPMLYGHAAAEAVTPLTQHAFSLLNNANQGQPPSYTLTDYDGEEWRQMSACQLDELTIKGNGTGLLGYTCSWMGNNATTPSAPSPSFSGTQTPAPWTLQALIGGVQVTTVLDWEFALKRQVKPIPALTGTKAYFQYMANAILTTGKLTILEQSGSPWLADFENGTRLTLDFTVFDLQNGAAMTIHCSKAQFITGELDRSKEYVEVPLDVQLLPTSTDALAGGVSPVKITIANSQSTIY
jgi:hypothetical protein